MDLNDLIPIVAIICVIGIPVAAAAIRFAIHPMVSELIHAVRGRREGEAEDLLQRMARLEEIVHAQEQTIDRLVEAEAFRRQLEAGKVDASARPSEGGRAEPG